MSEQKTVTITEDEYYQLVEDWVILNALRNVGVDNWEHYDTAMEIACKELERIEDERIQEG